MYTEYGKGWTSGDEHILVQSLSGDTTPKVLLRGAGDAQYLPTGHLAFLRHGTLYVVPFDAESVEPSGAEVAMLQGVAQTVTTWSANDLTLAGQFAISQQGTLAYLSGSLSLPSSEPVAVSRRGQVTPLGAAPATYRNRAEPSPDGTTFALDVQTSASLRLHLYDRIRGTLLPPLQEASDRDMFSPIWSRDGTIAISVIQGGDVHLVVYTPGATDAPELVKGSIGFVASSWSHDGERLVGSRGGDLWMYSMGGKDSNWTQLTKSSNTEQFPTWSPDGRWLAYASNLSGRSEVYVQPYPASRAPIPISTNRGVAPVWNPNGRELFYVEGPFLGEGESRMMSVDMSTPDRPKRPVPLFSFSPATLAFVPCSPTGCYAVARDGQTFFTLRMLPRQRARVTQIRMIFNWLEEVRRLPPPL